jgi:HEAT repeat protein
MKPNCGARIVDSRIADKAELYQLPAIALLILAYVSPAVLVADDAFLGRSAEEWNKQFASSDAQKRVYAAWAIAELPAVTADVAARQDRFESLNKLIHDADATVRYWGVLGLGRYAKKSSANEISEKKVSEALLPLLNDKSSAPRIAAAEAVCLLGQAEKGLPVIVAAMNDPQDSVRIQAAAALEKLGPAARPAISTLEKATSDSSEYVKRISERSLAALGVETKTSEPKAKAKRAKAKAKS